MNQDLESWEQLDPPAHHQHDPLPMDGRMTDSPRVALYKNALSQKHDQVEALQVELEAWRRAQKDTYKRNVILSKQLRNSNWIAMCAWLAVVGMLIVLWLGG